MAKIIHLRQKCIGCAVCAQMQPNVWRMSKKDGKAILLQAVVKRYTAVLAVEINVAEDARVVASACPVKIIKVL